MVIMGSSSYSRPLLLAAMMIGCMFGSGLASRGRDWSWGSNNWWSWGSDQRHHHPDNATLPADQPRTIIVGGSDNWHFNFSYTDWAAKNGPFFINDTLVFKYEAPIENQTRPHSVYELPDVWSFMRCEVSKGRLLANATEGIGEGFRFVLKEPRPYYFACGTANGIHCNLGLMRFSVFPLRRLMNPFP